MKRETKCFTAILLSCLLAFSSVQAFSTFAATQNEIILGDADGDKKVKIADATVIQRFLADMDTLDADCRKAADVNGDNIINIADATLIQKYLADMKTGYNIGNPIASDDATEPSTEPTTQPTTAAPTTQPTTAAPTTQPTTAAPTTQPTTPPTTDATAPNPTVKNLIDIYFTNNKNWSTVYFYLYNSETSAQAAAWPGTKITKYTTNDFGEKIYSSTVDVNKYDRVIFTNGTQQTVNVPINKASSGFYISNSSNAKAMLVATYAATGADGGKITKTNLTYSTGYTKKIWIWTPADYSATSADKYRTVYIMDGQNLFDDDHQDGYGGWEVTDAVESMMANGGRGVIIVGIDNGNSKRDSELTPDIGSVVPSYANEFSHRTGEAFSNFVVNTVMPYVQKNYNSSTARVDNFIAGSSSGGLEAFYIGLEHKDKFGGIGALSPAFLLFNASVWNSYLSKYDFTADDMPLLYIYNGNGDFENELYPAVIAMHSRLLSLGYSTDKIKLSIEENAAHNEAWWRIIFPEFLSWGLQI